MAKSDDKARAGELASALYDVASGAVDLAVPGAGVLATGLKALGSQASDAWRQQGKVAFQAKFERVLAEALAAMHDGDVDVATAHVADHMKDEAFQAQTWTVAQEMLSSPPCDEALTPLALLVAHYRGRRADQDFRRWVGWLCDAKPNHLSGATQLVVGLADANKTVNGRPFVIVGPRGPRDNHGLQFSLPSGVSRVLPEYTSAPDALSLLLEHELATRPVGDSGFGSSGQPSLVDFPPKQRRILVMILGFHMDRSGAITGENVPHAPTDTGWS